jgi:diacylglycerol kinase family enzyme
MTGVAVVAHTGKSLGGGLTELRAVLAEHGITDPQWYAVPKSKKAPKLARRALEEGADLVFVWGGDGMVQRCIQELAGSSAAVAIVPAGTANLLANNLGIPSDLRAAVDVGLHGRRRPLDVGVINGERFAVMAGTGFDALMIRDADRGAKERFGRLAYVWTGARNLRGSRFGAVITVDGRRWFKGEAGCVLLGNVGKIIGGLPAFDGAQPDDGLMEVGVVTAGSVVQWLRVLTRMAFGHSDRSPLVDITRGAAIDIRLDRALPYELDGGDRKPAKHLKVRVEPAALTVCVPS